MIILVSLFFCVFSYKLAIGSSEGFLPDQAKAAEGIHPGFWEIKDNALYKGAVKVNGNDAVVDAIGNMGAVSVAVYQGDVCVATTLRDGEDSCHSAGGKADSKIYQQVTRNGEDYVGYEKISGIDCMGIYKVIKNKAGQNIGMLYIGMPPSEKINLTDNYIKTMGTVSVILLIIFSAITFFLVKKDYSRYLMLKHP